MAAAANRSVALLSIHPEFTERIFDETKRVEFRRTRIPAELRYVIVYCTSPVQRVIGLFSVKGVHIGAPSTIWRQFREVSGISRASYLDYFDGSHSASAIEVKRVFRLPVPVKLCEIGRELTPPQSLKYLDPSVASRLKAIAGYPRRAA